MPPVREAELDLLMARLARGDRSAFHPLYAALWPRVLRLVAARLDPHAAADVAQSALLKVFASASAFTPGRPCLPWFYAIVANEIRAARRQAARSVAVELDADTLVDASPHAEDLLLTRELERAVELAVASLDADSAGAIAALLGRAPSPEVSAVTLRKRVSRAYARLRILLGDHDAS